MRLVKLAVTVFAVVSIFVAGRRLYLTAYRLWNPPESFEGTKANTK